MRYVIGAERETTKVYSHSTVWGAEGQVRAYGRETYEGIEQPTVVDTAWFAELGLPLITADNARPGLHSLQLSLQVRKDSYEFEGASGGVTDVREPAPRSVWVPGQGWTDTPSFRWVPTGDPNLIVEKKTDTTYRAGLFYQPASQFTARLSWQTAFKPPTPSTLFDISNPRTFPGYYIDPFHPDGETGYIRPPALFSSFNPDIKSQTSDTYRFALDWTPDAAPGLTLSADWSKTEFKDKFEYASTLLFNHPDIAFSLPSIVERDTDGYITQVNLQEINVSEKVSEILILYTEYAFQTSLGAFNPRLTYTRVLDEYFTVAPGTEPVHRAGTIKGSNKYTWQGSLTWIRGPLAADLFIRYIPSYENDRAGYCLTVVGRCERLYQELPTIMADSLTTVDLTLTWQFDNGLRLRGGARNLFDERSITPLENLPYDSTKWNGRARVLFLEVQYELGRTD